MSFTPVLHLAWKEYRAVRLFWLAIVGFTVIGCIIAANLTSDAASRTTWIFNLALVAPVLFALGSAAAAFSGEQEEGTFEFLQAAPVSSQQVLAGKIGVAVVGTVAMFLVLWPIVQWFNPQHFPDDAQLHNMLGLWLVAALEAIAWGTLFSLVTARPLLAVILAMAAASSTAHFLAWRMRTVPNFSFEFASYLHAAPWRILAAAIVLGIDIFLGRHWLEGTRTATKGLRTWSRRKIKLAGADSPAATSTDALAAKLMFQPDRGQMLGHLLWQHWRQSKWLMIIMVVVYIVLGLNINGLVLRFTVGAVLHVEDLQVVTPMAAMAALMGACVFLADQERRQFRFFVEHNVPPRYVWLTRQAAWLLTFLFGTLVICLLWLNRSDVRNLWEAVQSLTDWRQHWNRDYRNINFTLPPLGLALGCALMSYSAGQWCSMMIRSGIMAGFCGLIFASMLSAWVYLMNLLVVSWWWSVFPLPIVLLWATWLRAPEWVRENATWSAHRKTAVAVLAPALVLFIAVPIYRVSQIPLESPGFDSQAFEAEEINQGRSAAEMYRKANELMVVPRRDGYSIGWPSAAERRDLLKENEQSLALALEASQAPTLGLDPENANSCTYLLWLSGQELEQSGKFEQAFSHYLAAVRIELQSDRAGIGHVSATRLPFEWITKWSSQKGQTPEIIRGAIAKLQELKSGDSAFVDAVKNQYLLQRHWVLGEDASSRSAQGARAKIDSRLQLSLNQPLDSAALIDTLLPWERRRALRALNLVTADALQKLQQIQFNLQSQEDDPPLPNSAAVNFLGTTNEANNWWGWWWATPERIERFESTFPSPQGMNIYASTMAGQLVEFEARRRATMIVLALQAYRLEHGELPDSLQKLTGDASFFKTVPLDPYSGEDFRYFANGLPAPPLRPDVIPSASASALVTGIDNTMLDISRDWNWKAIVPGEPGIWSTGPDLVGTWIEQETINQDTQQYEKSKPRLYYRGRWAGADQGTLPDYEVWPKGLWFSIPNGKENVAEKSR